MSLLDTQSADTSVDTTTSTPDQTSDVSVEIPSWATGMNVDKEILSSPTFKNLKSVDDVVKGYYHAQKLVGADKAVIPSKNASSDEWRAFYQKAGLPESLDKYEFTPPESFNDEGFKSTLVKAAFENNIKPEQLSDIAKLFEDYNNNIVKEYEAEELKNIENTAMSLKKEWGDSFERNIAGARRVIEHFGGKETLEAVLNSPLANNPEFLKLMVNINGKLNKEDTFTKDVTTRFGTTKEDAKKKINEIYGNMTHPYFNENHAQHRDAVNEMLSLQKIISE